MTQMNSKILRFRHRDLDTADLWPYTWMRFLLLRKHNLRLLDCRESNCSTKFCIFLAHGMGMADLGMAHTKYLLRRIQ